MRISDVVLLIRKIAVGVLIVVLPLLILFTALHLVRAALS